MSGAYDIQQNTFGSKALDALAPDFSKIKPDPGLGVTNAPIPSNMDDGLYGRANFVHVNINMATTDPLRIRQAERRAYLLIQNQSLANMWIGFDKVPSVNDGIMLVPGGAYEPLKVPQGEIWVIGSAAPCFGNMLVGV